MGQNSSLAGYQILADGDAINIDDFAQRFEASFCTESPGAFVAPKLYRNALFNFVYHSLKIDTPVMRPILRRRVYNICYGYTPRSSSRGGWLSTSAGDPRDIMWIGLTLNKLPTPQSVAGSELGH